MTTTNLYIYDNITVVNINDNLFNNRVWNSNMYQKQLKVYRGITNSLKFVLKNQEQKPVNITGGTVSFILMDKEDGSAILQRDMTIIDGPKGVCLIDLLDGDTFSLVAKYYSYALIYNSDEKDKIVYSDTAYSVDGVIELLDSVYPVFIESQASYVAAHVADSAIIIGLNNDQPIKRHHAGSFNAKPSQNSRIALHSIQLFLTDFVGVVTVEGTLNQNMTLLDEDWAELVMNGESSEDITFNNVSGVRGYSFNGVFSKIRVKYRFNTTINGDPTGPLVDAGITPGNLTTDTSGTIQAPTFTIGESFWFNQTKVTMTGTNITTFINDFNAKGFENIMAVAELDGSIKLQYMGINDYDLSYAGVDKVLYRP